MYTIPTVSVCMITYGHEKYIEQAIEGVLMQKCDFGIELIVANDSSPDKTHQIISKIIENDSRASIVKYFKHEQNIGMMPNFLFAIKQCKGKYIAMCEGDDYWIDSNKLQKQADILNTNHALGMVYTGVKFYIEKENKFLNIPSRTFKKKQEIIQKMLESKFIEFPTTLFKAKILNKVIDIVSSELKNAIIGDTRILLEVVFHSEISFLEDITTVYRVADGSASYPVDLEKYLFALMDTYQCRVNFVKRNNLDSKLLAYTICNTNKKLINKAFVSKKYRNALNLLKSLLIREAFKNCNFKIFKQKISVSIMLKLFLVPLGIGVLKQRLKNES